MADMSTTQGKLDWIGVTPARRAAVESRETAEVTVEAGLVEDHHRGGEGKKRQVTLIQAEHLPVIATLCRRSAVTPELCRRNLLVSGVNLRNLRNRIFRIGEVMLQGTGFCPPCSRMDETLGLGGNAAMDGHGGITASVLKGGWIRIGDEVGAFEGDDAAELPIEAQHEASR